LLRQRTRFQGVAENAFITLHGKLNMTARAGYNPFFAATLGDLVQQWFEYVGLAGCHQHLNKLRSCMVEALLAHWAACLKQLEPPRFAIAHESIERGGNWVEKIWNRWWDRLLLAW
jgi:hypothetical protein